MSKIFTASIPGKLTLEDAVKLAELANGRNVVQIGAYCGRATVALAKVAKRLWVLDDFSYPGGMDAVVEELKRNVKEAGVDDKISFLYGNGEKFSTEDAPQDVTLVYRDANRMPEYTESDQLFALNALVNGGIYAWHGVMGISLGLRWMEIAKKPMLEEAVA